MSDYKKDLPRYALLSIHSDGSYTIPLQYAPRKRLVMEFVARITQKSPLWLSVMSKRSADKPPVIVYDSHGKQYGFYKNFAAAELDHRGFHENRIFVQVY